MVKGIFVFHSFLVFCLLPLTSYAKLKHSPCTPRSKLPGCLHQVFSTELQPYTPKGYPDHGLQDTMPEKGRQARGFYLTPYYFRAAGATRAARAMQRAHLNAVVIDIKDDLGNVLYPSKVPLSLGVQLPLIAEPAKAVATFHKQGIYVIGRIVSFKDSRLPYHRPDLAVRIGPRAERLFSAGANWIDAFSAEVQDYLIDLALELQELGFDEVQFDYIRFPKGYAGTLARWLHQNNQDRDALISGFLEKVDRALKIPISVDVYGLTTLVDGDPRTLGQTIEKMSQYVEAISPMMYANGMTTYFKNNTVTEKVYSLIQCGLWRARQKAPNIVLRPFLQAYSNSVEPLWGTDFIKKQIYAAERAGANGFLFWNATMQNGVAYSALQQMGPQYLATFGSNPEQYKNAANFPGGWCPQKGVMFSARTSSNKSTEGLRKQDNTHK